MRNIQAEILEIKGWIEEAESEEHDVEMRILKIKDIDDPELEKLDKRRGEISLELQSYETNLKELQAKVA